MSHLVSHLMTPQVGPSPSSEMQERILDAALACVARVGLAKTTLDDVAREARCARATLYRYFPGKQPLVGAIVEREARRIGDALVAATANCSTVEDALVATIVTGVASLERHRALQTVLLVEPEVLLPHLAFHRADDFLRGASAVVAPAIARFLPPGRAERATEWLVRIVLSFACSPSPMVDLHDERSVRQFVAEFVLPGLVPTRTTQGVPS